VLDPVGSSPDTPADGNRLEAHAQPAGSSFAAGRIVVRGRQEITANCLR
jgi:hypothetical protein